MSASECAQAATRCEQMAEIIGVDALRIALMEIAGTWRLMATCDANTTLGEILSEASSRGYCNVKLALQLATFCIDRTLSSRTIASPM